MEISDSHHSRFQDFSAGYGAGECLEIRDLIMDAGERLTALCLDAPAVNEVMTSLFDGLGLSSFGEQPWRTLWNEADHNELLGLPLAEKFYSLHGYAFYGLSPKGDFGPCSEGDVAESIAIAEKALSAFDLSNFRDLPRTLSASRARFGMDSGNGVNPEDLANLAEITLKSMKNALAPSSGTGLEVRDRKVTSDSALRWLRSRGNFRESVWHLAGSANEITEQTSSVAGEVLYVPFAKDGTIFHPEHCIRAGKYTVGTKGTEQTFSDYREALDHLARMRPAAYWRRPNTVGNWGIVTAVGFRPLTAEELGLATKEG